MKRILSMLLLLSTLMLVSCSVMDSDATDTTGNDSPDGSGSPPRHPSYSFASIGELKQALFVPDSARYAEIRSAIDSGAHAMTLERRQPYARMLTLFENEGKFPVPRISGALVGSFEATGVFTYHSTTFFMEDFLGLPEIIYSVVMPADSFRLLIEITPLIVAEDQTLQEYTDVEKFLSYMGKDLKMLGKKDLQLADRTVTAVYRYFNNNQEDRRYEYVFLYDGMYVRVIDTPEVLTDEFWSGFSIGEASK